MPRKHIITEQLVTYIEKGQADNAKKYISAQKINVNSVDTADCTPLLSAARRGQSQTISFLVKELGANVNVCNKAGVSAVFMAALHGHADAIVTLCRLGANLNAAENLNLFTPLHIAAEKGHGRAIRALAHAGAKIDCPNKYGATPVHIAAQKGHVEAIRALLRAGSDVNARLSGSDGATPLFFAARLGHLGATTLLAQSGANVHLRDAGGKTALDVAVSPAIRSFLAKVVEVLAASTDGASAGGSAVEQLVRRLERNDVRGGRRLRDVLNVDVNAVDVYNCTPLVVAATNGCCGAIKLLVSEFDANVDASNDTGATPLSMAAFKGQTEALKVLAELGADCKQPNGNGATPVFFAAQENQVECIRILANLGADLNAATKYGVTPAYIAARNGHVAALKVLGKQGASLEMKNNSGKTPLQSAVEQGHTEAASLLARLIAGDSVSDEDADTVRSKSLVGVDEQISHMLERESSRDPRVDALLKRMAALDVRVETDVAELRATMEADSESLKRFIESTTRSADFGAQLVTLERLVDERVKSETSQFEERVSATEQKMRDLASRMGIVAAQSDEMYIKYKRESAVCKEKHALLVGNRCVAAFYECVHRQLGARLQSALLMAAGLIKHGKVSKVIGVTSRGGQGVELAADLLEGVAACMPVIGGAVGALVRMGTDKLGTRVVNAKIQNLNSRMVTTEDALRLGELAARRCAQFFAPHIERLGAKLDAQEATKAGTRSVDVMYSMLTSDVKTFDSLLDEIMRTPQFAELSDEEVTARALVRAVVRKGMSRKGLRRHGGIFEIPLTEEEARAMMQEEVKKSGGGGGGAAKVINVHVSGPAAAMGAVLNSAGTRGAVVARNVAMGIRRGACKKHGAADCAEYRRPKMNAPDDGGACVACGCFPADHENLGNS